MDLTITLPEHVAAAFGDEETATAWLVAQATDYARQAAVAAASDQAQSLLHEAAAPFADATPPEVPTVAERLAVVAEDQTALRAQVREIGVTLAVAAGVPQEQAVASIDAALAVTPPDLPDAVVETAE